MGFKLIFAGLIFFFNPCVNIVDILPDFIGCILISAGLYRLSDVEDRFFAARRTANRLIPIYIAKLILSVYLPVRWKSGLLPFTFVYAVGEIILMIMLCTSLYGAIEYMANLHDGSKHLKVVGNVSKVTIIFMIVKNVLAFIPEAFALEKDPDLDLSYNARQPQTLTDAKPYVILFFTAVVLIFGIWCLYVNAGFFKVLASDKTFTGNLHNIYKERVLDNKKLMTRRRFKRFFVLMIIGGVLTLDLIIDAINFTPDIAAYLVMFAAAACLMDKKLTAKTFALLIPLGVVSVIGTVTRTVFEAGVNFRMDYESYLSYRVSAVDSGTAIYIGGALAVLEGILFIIYLRQILKSAAEVYSRNSEKADIPGGNMTFSIVSAAASVLCSVFVYVAPLVKAMYYNLYINDTLVNAGYKQLSEAWEFATGCGNVVLMVVTALFIYSIYSTKRKADFEL